MPSKKCTKCGEVKPLDDYSRDKSTKDGLSKYCRLCRNMYHKRWRTNNNQRSREFAANWRRRNPQKVKEYNESLKNDPEKIMAMRNHHYKRNYGITLLDYNRIFTKQLGRCAICNRKDDKNYLVVDHCHKGGIIRGLLCQPCNKGLGFFKDSPLNLEKAIDYLKNTGVNREHAKV